MVNLGRLADELKRLTAWQRLPEAVDRPEYLTMAANGIRKLYILVGKGQSFSWDMVDMTEETFSGDLSAAEEYIAIRYSQIELLQKVQSGYNSIVGYTTDALSVTHADKPFQYISEMIAGLEREIRVAYYKLTSYTGA